MKDHLEDLIYEETAKRLEIMEQPDLQKTVWKLL